MGNILTYGQMSVFRYTAVISESECLIMSVITRSSVSIRITIVFATVWAALKCVSCINEVFANQVIGLKGIFSVLEDLPGLSSAAAVLWMTSLLLWYKNTKKCPCKICWQRFIKIWFVFFFCLLLLIFVAFFDVNILGRYNRYGKIANLLLINDTWGTNRGFIWKKAIQLYHGFPLHHKLFGYGPNTFAILSTKTIYSEMLEIAGTYYDSVHNEYLHYLVTIGPFGLISYIIIFFSGIRQLLDFRSCNPYALAIAFGIICYMVQAIVNINVPLVAPMVWLLLSIGLSNRDAGEQ